jgi:uncharacterized protein (TIGR02145 family)
MKEKFTKILISFFVFMFCCFSVVRMSAQTEQDGTEAHPYLIGNATQLKAWAAGLNSNTVFYFKDGTYSTSKPSAPYKTIQQGGFKTHFKITSDIILNSGDIAGCEGNASASTYSWTPITSFSGTLDGDYHVISGMYCKKSSDKVAMFSTLTDSAVVTNLGLANTYFQGTLYVGGIAGFMAAKSVVEHCFVDGTIIGSDNYVGGIAGINEHGTVQSCYTIGKVSTPSLFVGGIVGCNEAQATVRNCYSAMRMDHEGGSAGGVTGYNYGSVNNCYYDMQLCNFSSSDATGMLTAGMLLSSWTVLGSDFVGGDGHYPYLSGFSLDKAPVRLSVLPVILYGEGSDYETADAITRSVTVGSATGATWSLKTDNLAATLNASEVTMNRGGWFMLTAELDGYYHSIDFWCSKTPLYATAENPLTIDSLPDLQKFRTGINSGLTFVYKHYKVPAGAEGVSFLQTVDLDVSSWGNWAPIGSTYAYSFRGTYDGGGHTIENMKFAGGECGFFRYVVDATVKNLNTRNTTSTGYHGTVGTVSSRIYNSVLRNCHNLGGETITLGGTSGGIVGNILYNMPTDKSYVINCSNRQNITSNGSTVGGVIGNANRDNSTAYQIIDSCVNYGNIVGSGNLGGVVGACGYDSVRNCINYGDVTGNASSIGGVGGFCQSGRKTVFVNDANYGHVKTTNTSTGENYVGGVNGLSYGDHYFYYCHNHGLVEGRYATSGISSYDGYFYYCTNSGEIRQTVIGSASNKAAGISSSRANYCLNTGKIFSTGVGTVYGIGGTATECVNAGLVLTDNINATAISPNPTRSYNVGYVFGAFATNGSGDYGQYQDARPFDNQMCPLSHAGKRATKNMVGTAIQSILTTSHFVYNDSMYPMIKGLDTFAIMQCAAAPVFLKTGETVDSVASDFKLGGKAFGVQWSVLSGEGVTINGYNATVTLGSLEPVVLGASKNGTVWKTVTLNLAFTPCDNVLTIESAQELRDCRDSLNSGKSFVWKGCKVKAYGEKSKFKLTTDIDLGGGVDTAWNPIVMFMGSFLGDNHTIRNFSDTGKHKTAGLFATIKNGHIENLTMADVHIRKANQHTGSICADFINSTMNNCRASGTITFTTNTNPGRIAGLVGANIDGSVISNCVNEVAITGNVVQQNNTWYHVGGIVARNYNATVKNCINKAPITVNTTSTTNVGMDIGGIVGDNESTAICIVDSCVNAGNITGASMLGGIAGCQGGGSITRFCYNYGKVSACSPVAYVASIAGITGRNDNESFTISHCYNTGDVTAYAALYVGGISSRGNPTYCYNAGRVTVLSATSAGGVTGYGVPQYCYNTNNVKCNIGLCGAITGTNDAAAVKCYYDKQMCVVKGINGKDVSGRAEGLNTVDMTGNKLADLKMASNAANESAHWVFTTGLYPRLKKLDTGYVARASVTPVLLYNEDGTFETVDFVNTNFPFGACQPDSVTWSCSSNALTVSNTCAANGNTTNNIINGMGLVTVSAGHDSVAYRNVQLRLRISEDNPLLIKSLAELKNFRDGINSDVFYYYPCDSTYHLNNTDPCNCVVCESVEITDGGNEFFFKLIVDIDMSENDTIYWLPIGRKDSSRVFKGHFDGGSHSIKNLQIVGSKNYQALFGDVSGSIKNLYLEDLTITNTGNYSAGVCAYATGSIITNCHLTGNSEFKGAGNYKAGLCAYLNASEITKSSTTDFSIKPTNTINYTGGIVGGIINSNIDSCHCENLIISTNKNASHTGGICGYLEGALSKIYHSYNENGRFTMAGGSNLGGIIGNATGSTTTVNTAYCYNLNTEITAAISNVGGIAGSHSGAGIAYCYNKGGFIKNTGASCQNIAGIVGGGTTNHYGPHKYVFNYAPVTSNGSKVGGICGYADGGITNSGNFGPVKGVSYVGGIMGHQYYGHEQSNNFNVGDITGSGDYVGGIVGYFDVRNNSSTVAFNSGAVNGTNYVGGIYGWTNSGYTIFTNSYNVGIITGKSYVGGIGGVIPSSQTISKCYNAGWVDGKFYAGALFGNKNTTSVSLCYYDKQMSNLEVAMEGGDVPGRAEGLLTEEMISNALQSKLGGSFYYENGLYPRLSYFKKNTAAITSVMPVSLSDTCFANDIMDDSFTMAGCDSVTWTSNNAVRLPVTGCTATPKTRGYAFLYAAMNDTVYKTVKLSIAMSEKHPIVITNREQFQRFRDCIDSNKVFYYDQENEVFYLTDNSSSDNPYIEIPAGGASTFFRLDCDVSLDLVDNWDPIGSSTAPFSGSFNGNGHTVSGMKITENGDYKGLFAYNAGTIKNLNVKEPSITGNGFRHGAICGNNTGTVTNCSSVDGVVYGQEYVGGLVGYNNMGDISYCYNRNDVTALQNVGGVCGYTTGGAVRYDYNVGSVLASRYFNEAVIPTSGVNGYNGHYGRYAGGVCGNATSATFTGNYNVGAVTCGTTSNGTFTSGLYGGGVLGYAGTTTPTYCWNAGEVICTHNQSGAILGGASAVAYYPQYSYYDRQSSGMEGGIGTSAGAIDEPKRTEAKWTEEMTGDALETLLGTRYVYADSLYPQIAGMDGTDASITSVTPVFMMAPQSTDNVALPFTACLQNGVEWSGASSILNLSSTNTTGTVNLRTCGTGTLKVSLTDDYKLIPIKVVKLQAATEIVTTCAGEFRWPSTGRVYSYRDNDGVTTIDYTTVYTQVTTLTPGCDSVVVLQLTIPPVLEITTDVHHRKCYGDVDDYAVAIATGGFGKYHYAWTREGSTDVISTSDRIDGQGPGTYIVTVTDSVFTECSQTATVVINEPAELLVTRIAYDNQCLGRNDGYIKLNVSGGTAPYYIFWGTTANDSTHLDSVADITINGLAAGKYTVQVMDHNGCETFLPETVLEGDSTPHVISAFGLDKMYDGVEVDPGFYTLTVDGVDAGTKASGDYFVLTSGDTLRAGVSMAGTTLKHVMSDTNRIVNFSITKDGVDRSCRYKFDTLQNRVNITPRNIILTSGTKSKAYDGTPLTCHEVSVSGDGFIAPDDTLSTLVTGTRTDEGISTNTFDATTPYTLTAGTNPADYNIVLREGRLIVGPQDSLKIFAESDGREYNGEPLTNNGHYITGTVMPEDTVLVVISGSQIVAGTSPNVVSSYQIVKKSDLTQATEYDYKVGSVNGTLTVEKRKVALVTESGSKVYDGTPLSRPGVTLKSNSLDFVSGEVTAMTANNSITEAGSIPNSIVLTTTSDYDENNYDFSEWEVGTLTVTKCDLEIVGASNSITYDGQEHILSSFTAENLVTGHTITGVTYEAKGTDPGAHPGQFSDTTGVIAILDNGGHDVKGSYNITLVPGQLTILQNTKLLSIISESGSYRYDGTLKRHREYKVQYNGEDATRIVDTAYLLSTGDTLIITPTGAGAGIYNVVESGDNAFTFAMKNPAHTAFYTNTNTEFGEISIYRREVQFRSGSQTSAYTGHSISANSVEASGNGFPVGQGANYDNFSSRKEVGSEPNYFTYTLWAGTDPSNYIFDTIYGTLTVTPAEIVVTPVDTFKNYAEPNPVFRYVLTGFVNGESESDAGFYLTSDRPKVVTAATVSSPAGVYNIAADTTGVRSKNYVFVPSEERHTLTVYPRKVTIMGDTIGPIEYDGLQHTYAENGGTGFFVKGGLLPGDTVASVVIAGAGTVAGKYAITISNAHFAHVVDPADPCTWTSADDCYEADYKPGVLTITPISLTLKANSLTHIYNGNTQTGDSTVAPHYTITGGHLVTNDAIVYIRISGSRAVPGTETFAIDSVLIVDTTDVHTYTDVDPRFIMNGGYSITLDTGTLTITDRPVPYEITVSGDRDTIGYDGISHDFGGNAHTYKGLATNSFVVEGNTFTVEGLTAFTSGRSAGLYPMTPTGTAVVKDANNNDVTSQFTVHLQDGGLFIKKRPLDLKANDVTVEFDGGTHDYTDGVSPYYTRENSTSFASGHTLDVYTITGERAIPGTEPLVITPNTTSNPSALVIRYGSEDVTANYDISLTPGILTVTAPATPLALTVKAAHDTVEYNSATQGVTGFDTLSFAVNGNVYTVSGLTTTDPSSDAVGEYVNAISGTAVVKDSDNNDVTAYFDVVTVDGNFKINKKAITIKADDSTKGYDGAVLTDNGWHDAEPVVASNDYIDTVIVTGLQATIGSSDNVPSDVVIKRNGTGAIVTDNYEVTYLNGTLTITPNDSVITVASKSREYTYDGMLHTYPHFCVTYGGTAVTDTTSDGLSFTLPTGDKLTFTPMFTGITNVSENNDHNNTFSYELENGGNYAGVRDTVYGTVRIVPATVTATITGHTSTEEYDGAEHKVTGWTVSYDNSLYGTSDYTFAGTETDSTAVRTHVGQTDMTLAGTMFTNTNTNFAATFDVTPGWQKIEPVSATVTVEIKGTSDSVLFTGSEQKVTGYTVSSISNPLYKDTCFTFTGSEADTTAKGTVIGNYTMGMDNTMFANRSADFSDVSFVVTPGVLTITPTKLTVKLDTTKHYDGTVFVSDYMQSADGWTVTGLVAGDAVTAGTVTSSAATVGTYTGSTAAYASTPVATAMGIGNYNVTYDFRQEITPLPTEVTITGHTSTAVYDGTMHHVSGYDMVADNSLYTVSDYTFTGTAYASRTDSGTTYMGLADTMFVNTNANFGPVTFTVTDGWQRITPIEDTVRVTLAGRTDARTYDGVAHTVNGYDVVGITGHSLYTSAYVACDTTATATRTDSGTTYMGLQPRHFRNTNANFSTVLFTVTDGYMQILPVTTEVVVEITGHSATAVYDNTEHRVTGYSVGHISNSLYTVPDIAYTGDSGDTVATRTDAGSDTMSLRASHFRNTSPNFTTVRFEVEPGVMTVTPMTGVTVEISGNTDTVTYNGYEHRVTGYTVTSVSTPLYKDTCFAYTGGANDTVANGRYTGTYPMGLDGTDFTNTDPNFAGVTFAVTDGSLVVKKNATEILITGGSAEKPYDGTPLTCADYTYTPGVIAPGDTLIAVTSGSRTEFGTSPNVIAEYAVFRNETLDASMIGYLITPPATYTRDVTDQYTFASSMVAGTLRITANGNAKVAITGHTAEYNYDGQPHTVSGYDVVITDTLGLYSATDFLFNGDSVETQTAVGTHPMGLAVTAFQDTNSNYDPVEFTVVDGSLVIYDSLTVDLAAAVTDVTCHGYADGAATLSVTGGKPVTPRYSYTVAGPVASTGSSDGTIDLTGLKPGHYLVTVEDALHYTDTASFDIAEPDTLTVALSGPADLCPNRTEYAVTAAAVGGNGGYHYAWGVDATDADADNTTITRTLSSDCGHEYTASVKVTDIKGCEAVDTVRFTVTDTETPSYMRPKDTVLYLSASCTADTTPASTGEPSALSDNCTATTDLAVTHYDRNVTSVCGNAYTFERVWRVVDACGNVSVVADSVQSVTVLDTARPVYVRPADTTVYKDALCNADTTPAVTGQPAGVQDNCTASTDLVVMHYDRDITATCAGSYTFERVWRVVDECGNVSVVADSVQRIKVLDTVKPTFEVPADTVICRYVATDMVVDPDKTVTGEPTAHADNCTDVATLQTNTTYTDVNPATVDGDVVNYIERHWKVADACGNYTEKVQRIGVFPAIHDGNTTLKCPSDIEITLAYGRCDTVLEIGTATVTTTVTGAGSIGISNDAPAGNRFAEGTTVVTWTATDTCGFTVTCQQTVVVNYPPCGAGHDVSYDGHVYHTVRVGCECWLQENLRNTHYADGTDVPASMVYGDDPSNEDGFGLLYTWYSAVKVAEGDNSAVPADSVAPMGEHYVKGICPDGWAMPTSAQYDDLWRNGYGTSGVKDKDAQYWLPGYAGTDPNCYFNARGAGYYDPTTGRYYNLLGDTYFWTGESAPDSAMGQCSVITHTCPDIVSQEQLKVRGQSVRCVQKK